MPDMVRTLRRIRILAGAILPAALITAVMFLLTHYYRGKGLWYAPFPSFKYQIDAFFAGRLSLSDHPFMSSDIVDMVWGRGIQEIFGLGVSAVQVPFELIAKVFGWKAGFPDRISFGNDWKKKILKLLIASIVFLNPVLIAALDSTFDVHYIAIYYTVLSILAVMAVGLLVIERPNRAAALGVAAACGLLVFMRPTAIFYGMTVVSLIYVLNRERFDRKTVLLGAIAFAAGPVLLLVTNRIRFGDITEFGFHLITKDEPNLRFQSPFTAAPLLVAARELFRYVFVHNLFASELVEAQLASPYYRTHGSISSSTFHDFDVVILFAAWTLPVWRAFRFSQKKLAYLWTLSIFPFFGLYVFYLWTPTINSRYVMEFVPAVGAGFILLFVFIGENFRVRPRWAWLAPATLLTIYLVTTNGTRLFMDMMHLTDGSGPVANIAIESQKIANDVKLPARYACGGSVDGNPSEAFKKSATYFVPGNLSGWDYENDCRVSLSSNFFFDVYECLNVQFELRNGDSNPETEINAIEVRSNLEYLKPTAHRLMEGTKHLVTFCRSSSAIAGDRNPYQFVTIKWKKLSVPISNTEIVLTSVEKAPTIQNERRFPH